jgi:DNA-directed RNA polymerase II subunit RPB2
LTDDGEYVVEQKRLQGVSLGKIPIMVRSNYCILKNESFVNQECKYDYGGYFIINGNEKVVISQDRISENKTFVFVNNKVSTYSHIAEIRSVQENRLGVPKITTIKLAAKPNQFGRSIRVNIHHIKHDIPIFILFKAFGLNNDKEIMEYIVYSLESETGVMIASQLMACVDEASHVMCERDAIEYLAKFLNITGYPRDFLNNKINRVNLVRQVLAKEVLPHVGSDLKKKALYVGYMVNKLVQCFLGIKEFDDRDSYINKRVDTPGVLLASIFRQYYGKMVKDMKNMIQKEINVGGWKVTNKLSNVINKVNVYKIVKSTIIDSGLRYALSTGNWGIKSNKNKQGVAQVLNRLSYNATLSHLRRINTPIEKSGKLVQPRKLHATQWGVICPAETPEGSSVGLVKNMAMMAGITICSNSANVRELIEAELGMIPFGATTGYDIKMFHDNTKVVINGDIVGVHFEPHMLYMQLKELKQKGCINIYTSVVWNFRNNEILVSTEGGRCVRPLFIVDNDKGFPRSRLTKKVYEDLIAKRITWQDLVIGYDDNPSIVEFMDVEEVNSAMIAMKYDDIVARALDIKKVGRTPAAAFTNMEIHPSMIMGVLGSLIPFSDHNQAPRVAYQASMAKQALTVYSTNFRHRFDTMGHVLSYGQRPIVKTNITNILNNDDLPTGINVIVAIATYTGFNQEDSVILNKSALDRGLFNSTYYKTHKEINNKNHSNGEEEFFTKPDMNIVKNVKPYNYDKLDSSGFVPENTFVKTGDVIVGKVMPTKVEHSIQYKDNSTSMKNNESGFIDKNGASDKYFTNTNGDGYNFAKVRIRSDRTPTIGDKFSSRHGQKGTCGMMYRQEDMPFTADGIVPDIIVNPHAIPSRMTIGQLMECIMGKACAHMGTFGYGTAFNGTNVEDIANLLENKCGMERYGNEILYNSRTGEQIHTEIFIGPTYYQRLKHMVQDKVHCLLADHDVLTLDGWKPIPQVTMNDKVATLKDGKVVYEHPINVLHFPNYKGKMYHIKNQQIDLDVTINHRMFVSNCYGRAKEWQPYKLVPANELVGKSVKYKKDADWTCEDYQFVLPAVNNHQEMMVDMEAWLAFFGIWYAEGWTDNGEYQQTRCNYRVTISVNKKRVKDALFPALERLGFHYWYNPKTEKLSIHNKQLYTYMSPLSVGAPNKKLPEWCFHLSKMQTRRLIDSMILGDGTYPKDTNRKVYYTSSTVLADQFTQLCLHAGWSSNKGVHFEEGANTPVMKDGRVINSKYAIYRLPVITNKNHPQVNHGHHKQQNIQEEYVYEYNGPVYCLQVPSEVFYIRRNGKPCWTGNSRSSNGPIVSLTHQPAEGRARDGGLRLGEMELECNWAHGTMQFLKERFMECSDNYRVFICKKCGLMANVNPEKNIYNCKNCKNITDFAEIRVPYAFKLLAQEVGTMAIGARFMT